MNRDFTEKRASQAAKAVAKAAIPLWKKALGGAAAGASFGELGMLATGEGYEGQTTGQILGRTLFNAGLGGLALPMGGKAFATALGAIPIKDLALNVQASGIVNKLKEEASANIAAANASAASDEATRNLLKWLGVGGLGLGGLGLWKYWNKKDPEESGGVLRYKLQGDTPGQEAEVEMPIDSPLMSPNMTANLDAGMRRRLQDTINLNSRKRDPMTGKLIPYTEWKQRYGDSAEQTDYMDGSDFGYAKMASEREYVRQCFNIVKSSAAGPPPPVGPTPPAGGPPPPPPGQKKVPGNQATREVKPGVSRPMTPGAYKPGADIRNVASNASKLRTQIAQAAGPARAPRRPGATRQMYDDMKSRIMSLRQGPPAPAAQ